MGNYDLALRYAKDRVACLFVAMVGQRPPAPEELEVAVLELNKAWDALTDCLVRQREERDRVIIDLLNQLAERKLR